jgi:hypothetical protein
LELKLWDTVVSALSVSASQLEQLNHRFHCNKGHLEYRRVYTTAGDGNVEGQEALADASVT